MDKKRLDNIIKYVNKSFSDDYNSSDQFKNYKKLFKYLVDSGEVIDTFDAEYLLKNSKKLNKMVECISILDINLFSEDESIISLLSIYNNKLIENDDESFDEKSLYAYEYGNHDLDLTRLYLEEIKHKTLTPEEEIELFKRKEAGDPNATEELIKHNLRLVVSIAKYYANFSVPLMDLIQEGSLGLMTAIEKYDYRKGYKLSTYATWWIRQSITRALADKGRTIRIPVHYYEMLIKLRKATNRFETEFGRKPTTEDLSNMTGIPEMKIEESYLYNPDIVSLDTPINSADLDDDTVLGDFITDPSVGRDLGLADIINEDFMSTLESLNLDERELDVIKRRFGFYGKMQTLEEIGRDYGLTRERIRQIENRSLKKLRRNKKIKAYNKY